MVQKIINTNYHIAMLLILFSIASGQDYNPCKDKRFLSLSKMDLDDMSDREYNYFIKKKKKS